jgi:pimeloyl-ACP methyl ester carboxylesterase
LAIGDYPVEKIAIPFEGAMLPGYLARAVGRESETRPLLILTNGYDATVVEMYFASAVAATHRGYHCLFFDGPGQGAPLIEDGIHLRGDWETVVRAVVDVAVRLPLVDTAHIALSGWSLGGYLSLRAATGEHRLAACIADPGLWGPLAIFGAGQLPPDAGAGQLAKIDASSARGHWSLTQRGYFVHGVNTMQALFLELQKYTLDGLIENIACPTLITRAENDALSGTAQRVYDALVCPKELLEFAAADGAGDHCELYNRPLLNARVFDWLDRVLS